MEEHAQGFMGGVVTIVLAIISVATLAIVLSRRSNTAPIIQNTASAVANDLAVAESPVTGDSVAAYTGYANTSNLSNMLDEF